jgi:hypothetical protein
MVMSYLNLKITELVYISYYHNLQNNKVTGGQSLCINPLKICSIQNTEGVQVLGISLSTSILDTTSKISS